MKKLFKVRYLVLILLVGLLVACGNNEKKDDVGTNGKGEMTIGYAINNLNDTFQTYILEAAKAGAKENNMDIRVENAKEDLITQQDQVNTLIQNGAKALIVVPVDTSAMGPITQAALDAKIPLVYVNRNPYADKEKEMPKGVYYVGSQEITAGTMQMEFIGEKLGGKGNIAILMGILGNEGTLKRTAGVEKIIKEKYPDIKILNKETADWQRDKAIALAENWISTYGKDLNAIIANNDEMALGALQAIKKNNRPDIMIIGTDAIPDAIEAIDSGDLTGTIFQDAKGQGGGAIKVITDTKSAEQVTYVPFQLITKDNVADFK